jgi:hypothetical protein
MLATEQVNAVNIPSGGILEEFGASRAVVQQLRRRNKAHTKAGTLSKARHDEMVSRWE